jgi:hypothetical protein
MFGSVICLVISKDRLGRKGTILWRQIGRVPHLLNHTVGAPSFRGVCERVGSILSVLHI